ncbi:MAG: glycosyltransferase family 4 protein [Bdellovibrionales bacterium]|jgi:glycosyltransferase involved in cell wall biosynthesis
MPLTVLQIIPALGSGGAEQACVDMAAALVKRGDRAIIVSTGGWREKTAEEAGAVFIKRDVATKNPARIIRNAFWLAELIRREGVDIVHARSRAPAWSAKIACRLTGCPFVTTFHAAYKFSSAVKRAYNSVMAAADRVIAISPFIAAHVSEHYGVGKDRLRLVDRGVDVKAFDPLAIEQGRVEALREAWGMKPEEKAILLPARLSSIKGHETVIRAVALLRKQGQVSPPVLLVGDDQGREGYTQRLRSLIQEEELDDVVRLVGACKDMAAAYALARLALQPSKVPEGFGRVPVEAMAAGVPVIASDLGGMKNTIVVGKTGWLVAPDDAPAWASAMAKALAMTPEATAAMGKTGRAHVAAHFTDALMIAKTLAVYDEVAAEKARP